MVGQQRQQMSELHFDKFLNPQSFFKTEDLIQKPGSYVFRFSLGGHVMDDELKSSRSDAGNNFQNFELLDAKIVSALNKIIQNSLFKKKVNLEEQKAQKDDPSLSVTTFV